MKHTVLISGVSIAGLSLTYWLNKFGYKVTLVEMAKGLRRGGSPIDVRGEALDVAKQMGILEKIKEKELIHTNEIVNTKNETLVTFNLNKQTEYEGDIEIYREDLAQILFENIPKANDVEFLFDNRVVSLVQDLDKVKVTFKNGENRKFEFVFGADGTHSGIRKLVFGNEDDYKVFFGAYFAIVETPNIKNKPNTVTLYQEIGKMAAFYPLKNGVNAFIEFRSPKLNYDYKNHDQHKQILQENFKNSSWRIPEIINAMVQSENLYFDEVCQIHMDTWSKGRVALVGDAAHTTSFHTGMGTSLAMQGATMLAKELQASNGDYESAFAKYYETYKPFVESIQARIERGLNFLLPETQEGIDAVINRFKQ